MSARIFSSIYFLLLPFFAFSQNLHLGDTYAVVIGISDYQDEGIPDLKYAHKDAEAFASFLQSPAGGSLDEEQIVLLTNEYATRGSVLMELYGLLEKAKPRDKVIIYFSGHSDVETALVSQPGYLLVWDALPSYYAASGTVSLLDLQEIVNTLTQKNQNKVILITDACRSGNLAGSRIDGPQRTTAALKEQFSNEVKILSCQANEYSVEGAQWGGGRGAFSFHLIDGLTGMADRNADLSVNLLEIERYLEDMVSREVAPINQLPVTVGDKNEILSFVDESVLNDLRKKRQANLPQITTLGSRAIEDLVFDLQDSITQEIYALFEKAIIEKRFLEPKAACADYYFQQMIQKPELKPLYSKITRNYAVALQDDAQQVLNQLLKSNTREITQSRIVKVQKYKNYPRYIERSAELLGEKHYMYDNLKARQYFFEGLLMWLENPQSKDKTFGQKIIDKYKLSLEYEEYAPHVHFYMQLCFSGVLEDPDSAYQHAILATEQIETWTMPFAYMAFDYSKKYKAFDKAEILLEKALAIDSQDVFVLQSLAGLYYHLDDLEKAGLYYKKIIALDSSNAIAWQNLGVVYYQQEDYPNAKKSYQKSVETNPNQYLPYYYLGIIYNEEEDLQIAEEMFLKSIDFNKKFMSGRVELGYLYLGKEEYEKAERYFKEVLELYPNDSDSYYHLACFSSLTKDLKSALYYLEQAFLKGEDDIEFILEDSDLDFVKKSKGFKDLRNKYFPNNN